MSTKKVTAIIPVFNEEKTIVSVLDALVKSEFVCEVICVNDGSTDKTTEVLNNLKDSKVKVIHFDTNRGKGASLEAGVLAASCPIILFLDGDLINLTEIHISNMVNPLLNNETSFVLGHVPFPVNPVAITGQRAYFREDLLPALQFFSRSRFGIEIVLNDWMTSVNKEGKTIKLKGLRHTHKRKKHGVLEWLKQDSKMWTEIARQLASKDILDEDRKLIDLLEVTTGRADFEKIIDRIKNIELNNLLRKAFNSLPKLDSSNH